MLCGFGCCVWCMFCLNPYYFEGMCLQHAAKLRLQKSPQMCWKLYQKWSPNRPKTFPKSISEGVCRPLGSHPCAEVTPRHHFGRILETSLNQYENRYEVLNFGRGNFSLPLTYYYYRKMAKKFNLDIALFFLERRDFQGHVSNYNVTRYELQGKILHQ